MTFLDPAFARHTVLWPLVQAGLPAGELAHDVHHMGRVYVWALRLAEEAGVAADLAGAAALVHDCVAVPKHSPERSQAGRKSAVRAEDLLLQAGYDDQERAAITAAVATGSWSAGLLPDSALGALLQDADRLDAIGAIGIARCFACHQHMADHGQAGAFYDPTDPLASTSRTLDGRSFAVDHFFEKLLRLRAGFHLPSAQAEAVRRHAVLASYLEALAAELPACMPPGCLKSRPPGSATLLGGRKNACASTLPPDF